MLHGFKWVAAAMCVLLWGCASAPEEASENPFDGGGRSPNANSTVQDTSSAN